MDDKRSKNMPEKRDDFTKEDLPEKIGKNLKKMYDDVLNEPVPDDFLSLLTQADKARSRE